ncbi:hypothetical protein HMPREF9344_00773 [Cutibacterium acnes HL097PA1]|nr:hypothetical protein HMPREF9574_00865 [Cutibacterium acnes HL074PA1]EFS48722.1 hypothetical protein HMPREF9585_01076 [Cutibacterium acnes HL083PA1]EFS55040.1 hypothetical protein HMPREF9593_02388 [Cutibacterium acnes HL046PA2]EFS66441.1 hypothetical protein HMPREF9612_01174 [Cutibacterium acnes HL063PA2]EFS99380.1 hypothetical protein HMPREF9609_01993 [Cutibacterium acnes HL027PA1]EFT21213.1 hypothetical protein HMPREF9566_00848 [Cutibacterium acnes HL045PA1]EFT24463.1 hypothetical protein
MPAYNQFDCQSPRQPYQDPRALQTIGHPELTCAACTPVTAWKT